jgi:tetratricopeptide (TPR) repeat protein
MVQGWLQGRASLSLEAPAGLAALPNPYDPQANAPYRGTLYYPPRVHDLSFYKGRLYAYFSPVPAVVAFLPFHLVTGRWLSHQQGCLLFCLAGFWGAAALLWMARGRFLCGAGDLALATAVFSLGFLSLGPLLLQRPEVWEVPIACAQAGWILALLSVLWGLDRGPADWRPALLAGTFAALAAGSRPSSLFCGVILLVPAARALGAGVRAPAARRIAALACLVAPAAAAGAALLAFNEARFGDWLEFGQKYQLNSDAARPAGSGHFQLAFLRYNLGLYALHQRGWGPHFPFIRAVVLPPAPPGHAGGDDPVGMVPYLPAILFALAPFAAWRAVPGAQRRSYLTVVGLVAAAGVAAAAPLLLFFGACVRYEFEFAMYFAILAGLGFLAVEASASGMVRALFRGAWCAALAASAASCLLMTAAARARTLATHGGVDLSRGNRGEALGHLQAALSLNPGLVEARALLGELHIQERSFESAAADYARALRDEPGSPGLLADYGYCLLQLGRDGEAEEALGQAVRIQPDFPQAEELLQAARRREAAKREAGGR